MNLWQELEIVPRPGITLVLQLKQQITWLIVNGRLKPGDQLPPVQRMAEQLGINLHTVRNAYASLAAEGWVNSRQGRGTHVLPFDPERIAHLADNIRSHTIGLIVPSWTSPFYHGLLQGIEEIAELDQTLIFLCNSHDDPDLGWRDYARLAAKQVDGILVASHGVCQTIQPIQHLITANKNLPVVFIDSPGCNGYSILIDLKLAGYQATSHLLEHGHNRIGLITHSVNADNVMPLQWGYEQALTERGLKIDDSLIARVQGFDIASGAEGARKLLNNNPPTAIFAITDLLAIGVMQVAKQAGVNIPKELAIVGFNDIPTASLVEPALTTVSPPAAQIGREAMRTLQLLIAGEQPSQRQLSLSTSLMIRESCGCPRKEG